MTRPAASPRYSPASLELEWNAFTSLNLRPSTSTVPPLFGPGRPSSLAPFPCSQPLSSTIATTALGSNFLVSSTVSPTWSEWPCVSAITSIRSGSFSESGHFGLPSHGSTYTRFPPGVSSRNEACPSQVSNASAIGLLSSACAGERKGTSAGRANLERMARRALPALLALAALVADFAGAHGFALAVLFTAIPAAFVLMLDCFADVLDARC